MPLLLIIALFQTIDLPLGLPTERAPHAASIVHGQFAVLRFTKSVHEINAQVQWTNIAQLPKILKFSATEVPEAVTDSRRLALVALRRLGARWTLYQPDVTAVGVPNTVRRFAALEDLDRFRKALDAVIMANQTAPMVDLLDARLPMVRQAALEILSWQTRLVALGQESIDRLGQALVDASSDRRTLSKRLRVMEQLGRQNTADWLSQVISTKLPAHLRGQAIGIMGRHLTRQSKGWLLQCAVDQGPVISRQCRRWLGASGD
ncbi:MAG: hypothetical protein ACON3Z_11430 [Bradymonadia bacterium]